jgi:hypothetical protein
MYICNLRRKSESFIDYVTVEYKRVSKIKSQNPLY